MNFLDKIKLGGILIILASGQCLPTNAKSLAPCSNSPLNSISFIKAYHLLETTNAYGIYQTNDNGYLLTGDTIAAGGMAVPHAFSIKTDASGNALWMQQVSSQSAAQGTDADAKRLVTQTTDGNFVLAHDIIDFVNDDYFNRKELWGDILVSKISPNGKPIWSILLGDYSMELPQKLWPTGDGGVLLLIKSASTGYGKEIADIQAIPHYSALIKINENGQVAWSKKLNFPLKDMQYLPDGSFIALADITLTPAPQAKNILGPEMFAGALPTIIKLNSKLDVEWAKSLEMIPSEIKSITGITENKFTTGITKIRAAGGDFKSVQSTPDNGFLVFGFDNFLSTIGLKGATKQITQFDPRPIVAVKIDAKGNYKWAKKLTPGFAPGISATELKVTKTSDNNFVIMQDAMRSSINPQQPINAANYAAISDAWATNVGIIKIDPDFNLYWIKKIDVERHIVGYGISPTKDNGLVLAANIATNKLHQTLSGKEPYNEAVIVKIDANGHAGDCSPVTDIKKASVQDQSSYLVVQNMKVQTSDFKLPINKFVNPKFFKLTNTTRSICSRQNKSIIPDCSYLGTSGTPTSSPVALTWAQINFDNAKEGKIETEKSRQIHQELLPILNSVFNNKVKMTDNTSGLWLTYFFNRAVTRADIEAIQKKYLELGYKIDESSGGHLYVSKVGRSLRFNFSMEGSMEGKLELML